MGDSSNLEISGRKFNPAEGKSRQNGGDWRDFSAPENPDENWRKLGDVAAPVVARTMGKARLRPSRNPSGKGAHGAGRNPKYRPYTAAELALFAAWRPEREKLRPAACRGPDCGGCWVALGPPGCPPTSNGSARCSGCGGIIAALKTGAPGRAP